MGGGGIIHRQLCKNTQNATSSWSASKWIFIVHKVLDCIWNQYFPAKHLVIRTNWPRDEQQDRQHDAWTDGPFENTAEPRYSASQGTGQNYALNRGFHYIQYRIKYENASWDQNLHALLAEIRYKRVRYCGVSLYWHWTISFFCYTHLVTVKSHQLPAFFPHESNEVLRFWPTV